MSIYTRLVKFFDKIDIDEMQEILVDQEKEIQEKGKNLEAAQKVLQSEKKKNEKLGRQKKETSKDKKRLESEIKELQIVINQLKNDINSKDLEISELTATNQSLLFQKERLDNKNTRIHNYFLKICSEQKNLKVKYKEKESVIELQAKQIQKVQSENKSLSSSYSDVVKQNENLKKQTLTLEADLATFKSRCADNDSEIESLSTELKSLQSSYESLTSSNLDLIHQNETLQADNLRLTNNSAALESKCNELENDLQSMEEHVTSLQSTNDTLSLSYTELTKQNKDLHAKSLLLDADIAKYKSKYEASESELKSLTDQVNTLQSTIKNLTSTNLDLVHQKETLQAEKLKLTNDLADLDSKYQESERNTHDCADLENQIKELNALNVEYKEKIRGLRLELASAHHNLKKIQDEASHIEVPIEKSCTSVEKSDDIDKATMSECLKDAAKEISKLSSQITLLNNENEKLKTRLRNHSSGTYSSDKKISLLSIDIKIKEIQILHLKRLLDIRNLTSKTEK